MRKPNIKQDKEVKYKVCLLSARKRNGNMKCTRWEYLQLWTWWPGKASLKRHILSQGLKKVTEWAYLCEYLGEALSRHTDNTCKGPEIHGSKTSRRILWLKPSEQEEWQEMSSGAADSGASLVRTLVSHLKDVEQKSGTVRFTFEQNYWSAILRIDFKGSGAGETI